MSAQDRRSERLGEQGLRGLEQCCGSIGDVDKCVCEDVPLLDLVIHQNDLQGGIAAFCFGLNAAAVAGGDGGPDHEQVPAGESDCAQALGKVIGGSDVEAGFGKCMGVVRQQLEIADKQRALAILTHKFILHDSKKPRRRS